MHLFYLVERYSYLQTVGNEEVVLFRFVTSYYNCNVLIHKNSYFSIRICFTRGMAYIKDRDAKSKESLQDEIRYLRSKVEDLSSLIDLSIIINSTNDLDSLVALVMEKAQRVMKAEASSVMLINDDKTTLECAVALGEVGDQIKQTMQLKMGEGIAGWVAANRKPIIVPDVSKDPRFSNRLDKATGFQTHSILAAPLIVKDKTIGVAEVINRLDGKAFNQDDLNLFSTFCYQVALAIENARMYHLELERQKIRQQLESARIIQQSFMPEAFPTSPNHRFEIAATSNAAVSVGGDFFDFIEFDENCIGVTVGDVSGKGIPAALFMARLVSDFRLYTRINQEPSQVMNSLNRILHERSRRGMFVTFLYGVLDATCGLFKYANAGHIPFIHISGADNKAVLLRDGGGLPLGIKQDFIFQQSTIQLRTGDYIVMITDGIVEAKDRKGQAYSLDRVMQFLSNPPASPKNLVDDILTHIQVFSKGMPQHDDVTIVALRWIK